MLEFLNNYAGHIFIENQEITFDELQEKLKKDDKIKIHLEPYGYNNKKEDKPKLYRFEVQEWMTKPSSGSFLFMQQWNENIPMPLRIMEGSLIKETRGMYYIQVHAPKKNFVFCCKCGRLLTNEKSKVLGIGPECLHKIGIPYEDINNDIIIKNRLNNISWTGWIAKSAIIKMEEVNN